MVHGKSVILVICYCHASDKSVMLEFTKLPKPMKVFGVFSWFETPDFSLVEIINPTVISVPISELRWCLCPLCLCGI